MWKGNRAKELTDGYTLFNIGRALVIWRSGRSKVSSTKHRQEIITSNNVRRLTLISSVLGLET